MTRFTCAASLAFLTAWFGAAAGAGDLKSGPDVGEGAQAFTVKDITGPNKGDSLCYR